MSDDILSHFTVLDELIQVIYQSVYRFVVLSSINSLEQTWTIHLSMVGKEGKWWRGVWTADNIRTVVVRTLPEHPVLYMAA